MIDAPGPGLDPKIIPFGKRPKPPAASPQRPDDLRLVEPVLTDKEGTWGSPVAMLQHVIDRIEKGELNPEDVFLGVYEENEADGTYCCRLFRYNLSPLEVFGRIFQFLRDFGV